MTTKEIKIVIEKANEIGSFSAKNNLSRTPALNSLFNDFFKGLDINEMSSENLKISTKVLTSFMNGFTEELLKIARVNFSK